MVKAFISYAHEDIYYRNELVKHLSVLKRNGQIEAWTDKEIMPGEEWKKEISERLLEAELIFLLISPDFISSDYCYDIEMKAAVNRHNVNDARVIPIILRFCDWADTPFAKLQALPSDGKPIKDWIDIDNAFMNIVDGIKFAIKHISDPTSRFYPNSDVEVLQSHISDIRKKMWLSKNERELQILHFEVANLKNLYPKSFELMEIGNILERSTNRPRRHPESFEGDKRYHKPSSSGLIWLWSVILGLVAVLSSIFSDQLKELTSMLIKWLTP